MKKHLKTVWKSFIEFNWFLACLIWKWQNKLVCYLTSSTSKSNVLGCGIAGMIYYKNYPQTEWRDYPTEISDLIAKIQQSRLVDMHESKTTHLLAENYLNGCTELKNITQEIKSPANLYYLYRHQAEQKKLQELGQEIQRFAQQELQYLRQNPVNTKDTEIITTRNNLLLDVSWALCQEIVDFIAYASQLVCDTPEVSLKVFEQELAIASILRGLDKKLETRGRDSCGLSIMIVFEDIATWQSLQSELQKNHDDLYRSRSLMRDLKHGAIDLLEEEKRAVITFTYKTAKAIGQLGDNIRELKNAIQEDAIFREAILSSYEYITTIVHTRWASQGIVSLENCHPVDNKSVHPETGNEQVFPKQEQKGHIYAVLNGDIDNYNELRNLYEEKVSDIQISEDITTDAKVIPLMIEYYYMQGNSLEESFRLAVNQFRGSFAIEVHSDLEPGKIYLAQQGKGQGLYVGVSSYGYHVASEVYGFVEQTNTYFSMSPGEICVLDRTSVKFTEGEAVGYEAYIRSIRCLDFHGNTIELSEKSLCQTPITTRDIFLDTTKYSHFLEKEIHEAPEIIQKTLQGKFEHDGKLSKVVLSESILPKKIRDKFHQGDYKKVLFLGMGTAFAAADAVALTFQNLLETGTSLQFQSILATEFTASYTKLDRRDTLVVAISQSGGTTDTNTAIRKLAEDQADVLGIVNKRDSDMTFLVDGVFYTGDGRDIEIAVASTKAFYAQVVAGTLYALALAAEKSISSVNVSQTIQELLQVPQKLRELLQASEQIRKSADELAPKHVYWDTLSTGVGQAVAKEIKIKLSELCYMSVPVFLAANKKHINLSAEALILCFFGAIQQDTAGSLHKDLQGEISIFLAQHNTPIVFTTTDDETFDQIIHDDKKPYQLLKVIPPVPPSLAVIFNTAAGHLWSYFAAKALHQRSLLISEILDNIAHEEERLKSQGLSSYEIIKDSGFQKVLQSDYLRYAAQVRKGFFKNGYTSDQAMELEHLMLACCGAMPLSILSEIHGENWSTHQALAELKSTLVYLRSWLARSIDAIKHQAKYITVGVTGFEGIVSMTDGQIRSALLDFTQQGLVDLSCEDLNEYDMITLRNIQKGVAKISGGMVYEVFYEEDDIFIQAVNSSRFGTSSSGASRYENKSKLQGGRKAMTIKNSKVNIGIGHDQEKIVVVPLRSLGKITKLALLRFECCDELKGADKVEMLGGLQNRNSKASEVFVSVTESKSELIRHYSLEENVANNCLLGKLLEEVSVEELLLTPHEDISEKILARLQG